MPVRIGLGLGPFPFSDAAAFWRWVDACEAGAVDSIWLNERLVSVQSQLEPLSALAAVAGRTRRLKFGMNATVLPLRDPLVLAKECATIDYLSDGRLITVFGVGNDAAPEWEAIGAPRRTRGRRANEMLALLPRLWTEDRVDFDGEFFHYKGVSINPKPRQSPLPLWIGGSSEAAIERTARYGTGWLGGGGQTPDDARRVIAAIRERAVAAGRAIDDDHYGAGFAFRFGSWDEPVVMAAVEALKSRLGPFEDPRARLAVGGVTEVLALVEAFRAAGVTKFVLRPIASGDADFMEQTRRLDSEILSYAHKLQ